MIHKLLAINQVTNHLGVNQVLETKAAFGPYQKKRQRLNARTSRDRMALGPGMFGWESIGVRDVLGPNIHSRCWATLSPKISRTESPQVGRACTLGRKKRRRATDVGEEEEKAHQA
jgi:hypothetical protein